MTFARELNGWYVVADLEGKVFWKKEHSSAWSKAGLAGKVAALLEPGTLWAWGKTEEEAVERVQQHAERIKGTRPLPCF